MRIRCPKCKNVVTFDEASRGQTVACPECQAQLRLPPAAASAAPPPLPTVNSPPEEAIRKPATSARIVAPPPPQRAAKDVAWQFDAQRYRSETWLTPGGVAIFLALLVVGAIILGTLASVIGHFFWLVVLFPILVGAGLGYIGGFGLKIAKVNSPVFSFIAVFCAAIVAVLTNHFADYVIDVGSDPILPPISFLEYTQIKAEAGVTIKRGGTGGFTLSGIAAYIYWGVEGLIILGVALYVLRGFARAPFCIHCKTWKRHEIIGDISLRDEKLKLDKLKSEAAASLEAGDLAWLRDHASGGKKDRFAIGLHQCPNCDEELPIEVELAYIDQMKQGEPRVPVSLATYPADAVPTLRELIRHAAEAE